MCAPLLNRVYSLVYEYSLVYIPGIFPVSWVPESASAAHIHVLLLTECFRDIKLWFKQPIIMHTSGDFPVYGLDHVLTCSEPHHGMNEIGQRPPFLNNHGELFSALPSTSPNEQN